MADRSPATSDLATNSSQIRPAPTTRGGDPGRSGVDFRPHRRPSRDRPAVGGAHRRRRHREPMRLAEGPLRTLLAGHPEAGCRATERTDGGQGLAGPLSDAQVRHRRARSRRRTSYAVGDNRFAIGPRNRSNPGVAGARKVAASRPGAPQSRSGSESPGRERPRALPGMASSGAHGDQARLIEVKTTIGRERMRFHITRNELTAAENRPAEWRLLRLWKLGRGPGAFERRPPCDAHMALIAPSYEARCH